MATQLNIVNKALGHIAIAPITSMSENSPAAILASSIWETCRQEVLKGHDWSFATQISTLATASYTIVAQDWIYAYQYPTDALEVWHVYYTAQDKRQDFRRVYDPNSKLTVLLSNTSNAIAEYTVDITDTTLYDANFVSVLAYFLAANMAKPLTGDQALADGLLKIYNAYVSDAERMSSYEAGGPTEPRSAFVDARAGATLSSEDRYTIPQRQP
jgi:hypothetical protein